MNIKLGFALGMGLFLSTCASAQIFFNDFPAGDGYNANSGWAAFGSNPYFTSNFQFKSLATGQVGSVTVGIDLFSGTNKFLFDLYSDNAGAPGTLIREWTATGVPTGTTVSATTVTGAGPNLTAGTAYWFAVAAGDVSTQGAWGQNTTGAQNPRDLQFSSGGAWTPEGTAVTGAFRLQAVPEPSTLAVAGLGIAALIRRRRSRVSC